MFKITNSKGFHLSFSNGWTVSVQWSPSNYCERRSFSWPDMVTIVMDDAGCYSSKDAEVMVWHEDGRHLPCSPHDDVAGWCSADQVGWLIAEVSTLPAGPVRKGYLLRAVFGHADIGDNVGIWKDEDLSDDAEVFALPPASEPERIKAVEAVEEFRQRIICQNLLGE